MKKVGIASLVVTLMVCGSPPLHAADESSSSGSTSSSGEKASAASRAPAPAAATPAIAGSSSTVTPAAAAPAPAAAAPVAPIPAASAPTAPASTAPATPPPQVSTIEGAVTAVDLKAASPSLSVGSAGKVVALVIDPRTTSIWQNGQLGKLEQLKVGQSVRVRHILKDGKSVAKSVQILPATSAPVAPAASSANKIPAAKAN